MANNGMYDKIYRAVQRIPKGRVATYGQVATMAGNGNAARAVGNALHVNPAPGVIPCHRVVNAKGRLAPGFAFGGEDYDLDEIFASADQKMYEDKKAHKGKGNVR